MPETNNKFEPNHCQICGGAIEEFYTNLCKYKYCLNPECPSHKLPNNGLALVRVGHIGRLPFKDRIIEGRR